MMRNQITFFMIAAIHFDLTTFTRCRHNLKTVRNLTIKNSLLDFDAKEMYLRPRNRPVSFQKCRKDVLFTSFSSVQTMLFQKCTG